MNFLTLKCSIWWFPRLVVNRQLFHQLPSAALCAVLWQFFGRPFFVAPFWHRLPYCAIVNWTCSDSLRGHCENQDIDRHRCRYQSNCSSPTSVNCLHFVLLPSLYFCIIEGKRKKAKIDLVNLFEGFFHWKLSGFTSIYKKMVTVENRICTNENWLKSTKWLDLFYSRWRLLLRTMMVNKNETNQ